MKREKTHVYFVWRCGEGWGAGGEFFLIPSLIVPCMSAYKYCDIHKTRVRASFSLSSFSHLFFCSWLIFPACTGERISFSLWHRFGNGGWLQLDNEKVENSKAISQLVSRNPQQPFSWMMREHGEDSGLTGRGRAVASRVPKLIWQIRVLPGITAACILTEWLTKKYGRWENNLWLRKAKICQN